MKLLLATNNAHKAAEVAAILGPVAEVVSLRDAGISVHMEENGATFAQNALIKAEGLLPYAAGFDGVIADDSGLCVDALSGEPGVRSARYAGLDSDDAHNNRKLLSALADVPEAERTARFVSVVAFARQGMPSRVFEGRCEGKVLSSLRGRGGFGYDPLFLPDGYAETFGEMDNAQKNRISHRCKALEALRGELVHDSSSR